MPEQQGRMRWHPVARWIVLLPGALLGAVLALVPVHASLYVTFHSETIQGGHIEPIERALTPFVLGFFFVLAGTAIAPSHKRQTSLLLMAAWWLLFGTVLILARSLAAEFGARSIGSVVGPVAAHMITMRKST